MLQMENVTLKVTMFGSFSLNLGGVCIDDKSDRSKKLWLLLAYMLQRRPRPAGSGELNALLWGGDGEQSAGALKTTMHRLRAMLDKLSPGAGKDFISYEGGSYRWNAGVEVSTDAEDFDKLCRAAGTEDRPERKAELLEQAAELYRGAFLERLSSEAWVVPLATYYHNLYIKTVTELLPLLLSLGRTGEAMLTAERAIEREPYQEEFYRFLMQIYVAVGRCGDAVELYERLRRLLLHEFGVIPEEDTRAIYQKAVRAINGKVIHVDFIKEQLQESEGVSGCMVCDYEFFKVLYRAEARAIARSGNCVHISLISLSGEGGGELSPRSLERAMENMEDMLRSNLRKGDIISRCSASQFVVMLPQANYENSRMVSERVLRAFSRRYPHSPARLDYCVWALEPAD